MNTEQNYVGGGFYANPNPPLAENGLQTPSTADSRQPLVLSPSYQKFLLDNFVSQGGMTQDERDWSSIEPIPDSSMLPVMAVGGAMVLLLLDPSEFSTAIGKVASVRTKENPDVNVMGRLASLSQRRIVLKRDNCAFSDIIFLRKEVSQLSLVTYSLFSPIR